jgi:hypothetical protein
MRVGGGRHIDGWLEKAPQNISKRTILCAAGRYRKLNHSRPTI